MQKKPAPKKEPIPKKKKEPIIYNGVEYDSSYEPLMTQWLDEAKRAGYVDDYRYHPDPIVLIPSIKRKYMEQGKTKLIPREEALFPKIVYTPDFIVIWTQKAIEHGLVVLLDNTHRRLREGVLVAQTGPNWIIRSIIDVKPPIKHGGHNSSYRDLGIKAPLIYHIKGYYIQSVVPVNNQDPNKCLFSDTWAPREYIQRMRVDGKGFLKSHCNDKTVEEYGRTKEIRP